MQCKCCSNCKNYAQIEQPIHTPATQGRSEGYDFLEPTPEEWKILFSGRRAGRPGKDHGRFK